MTGQSTALLALIFKVIKILVYFYFQALLIRRASRKWENEDPVTLDIFTFAFFFCMMLGSLSEIIWLETSPAFYKEIGALYI